MVDLILSKKIGNVKIHTLDRISSLISGAFTKTLTYKELVA